MNKKRLYQGRDGLFILFFVVVLLLMITFCVHTILIGSLTPLINQHEGVESTLDLLFSALADNDSKILDQICKDAQTSMQVKNEWDAASAHCGRFTGYSVREIRFTGEMRATRDSLTAEPLALADVVINFENCSIQGELKMITSKKGCKLEEMIIIRKQRR